MAPTASTLRRNAGPVLGLIASVSVLALTGCDDVLLFDVFPNGDLLVACEADGRIPLVAEGGAGRHLVRVDHESGEAQRLTRTPRELTWPRACPGGLLFVERQHDLVLLAGEKARVLHRSARALFQPAVSPDGARVAVLEADRLGVAGDLLLIDLERGAIVQRYAGALLGACWTEAGELVFGRARAPLARPFDPAAGEIVRAAASGTEVLYRGTLPAITLLCAAGGDVLSALPGEQADGPLGVVRVAKGRVSRGEAGAFEFWPAARGGALLFTRTSATDPKLQGELRLARTTQLTGSRVVPTPGPVAAPRWLSDERVAFITLDNHLVVQDLEGAHRLDLTDRLRTAFAHQEPK